MICLNSYNLEDLYFLPSWLDEYLGTDSCDPMKVSTSVLQYLLLMCENTQSIKVEEPSHKHLKKLVMQNNWVADI